MPNPETLAIVRRYHHGWSTRNYDRAIDVLSPSLKVEVPINDYPTIEAFAQALRGFSDLVTDVQLLAEMSSDDEAILLYDILVEGLGELRVVEHFTVADGKIIRLRQIHDTAGVRAAGLAA
jgi:SnoaL-like domain